MKNIEKIPGKNPFKVPDNYFEEVNLRIISATTGSYPEMKNPGIYRRFRPYILAAASVTGFVILSYTLARFFQNDKINSESEESYTAILNGSYINDIDILTLEENAVSLEFSYGLSGIGKSEIIDYLMHENIELDDIYEEF
jgi:hypothetical protein